MYSGNIHDSQISENFSTQVPENDPEETDHKN